MLGLLSIEMPPKIIKRLKAWYRGYGEYPEWFSFCSLIFAFASLTFIIWLFGPYLLNGDAISYGIYQSLVVSAAGSLYIVILVVTFIITVISGIPIFWYEWMKRMRKI
jgi:hypothetical protein